MFTIMVINRNFDVKTVNDIFTLFSQEKYVVFNVKSKNFIFYSISEETLFEHSVNVSLHVLFDFKDRF